MRNNMKMVWGKGLLAVLAGALLSACAPVNQSAKNAANVPVSLVYPAPPDEPRFIFERTIAGSADVVGPTKKDAADSLRSFVTGTGNAETTEPLGKPYAVAVHRGRIFVSDSTDRLIKVFDVPAGKYYKIGDDPRGTLSKPLGLDVDAQGNVYVVDATAKAVLVYNPEGKFLRRIGGPNFFDRLSSVTVDAVRGRILVVDIGGVSSEHHRVRVFDMVTGNHVFDIGSRGNGPGQFNLPRDAAVGKNGQIYVVDGGNFRVQIFDAQGKYLQSFGSVGKQLGNFARPKEVATDVEGNVYVIDAAFGNFQLFTSDGELLMYLGNRSERGAPGEYMLPSGIYSDEDGRVYVVDQWFRKVDIFRPYHLAADAGYLGKRPVPSSNR